MSEHGAAVGELERAAFVVSIDVEMAWGVIHRPTDVYRFEGERAQMSRLLDLFDRHEIPATWAFVGHLLLDRCERHDGVAHPDVVRPDYSWFDGDWFSADPATDLATDPTWYAPDLLEDVRRRAVGHEIGSHSFSHLIAGDPGCSEAAFRSDLDMCRRLADERGLPMSSFIFPRNRYGHEHALADAGFRCYRGPRTDPFDASVKGRASRVLDQVSPGAATVVRPVTNGEVWNLPATYLHDVGRPGRYRPRLWQAKRRLSQAVRHRGLFHAWFHPHNANHETERWFDGFEQLLERAARLRDEGHLETITMSELVDRIGTPSGVSTA